MVSIAQLHELGFSKDEVWKRARAGRLHRVYRGVYAVGHAGLGNEGRWAAAVLAHGLGAVLSHRSAAELWTLLPPRKGPVDVTVPSSNGRASRPTVRLHRSPSLPADAIAARSGISVTTPRRTLTDLDRVADAATARRARRQAATLGLWTGEADDRTRSELEYRFLRLCRRHRLPLPEVNVPVAGFVVDFLWRGERLVVETDGYRFHRGRLAFEADHVRQLKLQRLRLRVLRFTYRQVTETPREVAAAVRAALASSSS